MELNLRGNIIGIISDDFKDKKYDGLVKDIVLNKTSAALKMVGLDDTFLDISFSDLSISNKSKVILASKLQDREIMLINFSMGLTKKEMDTYKKLFKRIVSYGRKVILVDKNSEMFINCVDNLYVINKEIILETDSLFDKRLRDYISLPRIVDFTYILEENGININHYTELDELLKAIYRIKS